MFTILTLLAVIAVALMLLEHFSYQFTHDAVKRRYASGDKSCGVQKTWWGWRVREYGEGRVFIGVDLAGKDKECTVKARVVDGVLIIEEITQSEVSI